MAEVVLFHHALGRTPGVLAFAEGLRRAGYVVHTPDLYDGRGFDDLDSGVAFAESLGMPEVIARGRAAVADLPAHVVYAGFSLGTLPAQALAQRRPGAAGAVLLFGGEPLSTFGPAWQAGVPLLVQVSEGDPWVEVAGCRALVDAAAAVAPAQLVVHPGAWHLVTDPASADHDPAVARHVTDLVERFLADHCGTPG
jgi:dienelactone hydrolase